MTPHRKISAATFEGGSQSPLLTRAEDGSMSFLTVPPNVRKRSKTIQTQILSSYSSETKLISKIPEVQANLLSDLDLKIKSSS